MVGLYGTYCKNRICITCNRNRKAEMINNYYSLVKGWKDPHAVLLTAKSVRAYRLRKRFDQYLDCLRILKNRFKTKFRRGKDIKLVGIRALESSFNPKSQTYNPHFHLLVPDARVATVLRREWSQWWENDEANPSILRPYRIKDIDKELMELIKYFAKFWD